MEESNNRKKGLLTMAELLGGGQGAAISHINDGPALLTGALVLVTLDGVRRVLVPLSREVVEKVKKCLNSETE